MLGLYLHIPFCGAICHYCNFNRGLLDAGLKARYVDALDAEIRRAADGSVADTIYFGGGTPSLLAPDEVARLIAACRESFAVTPDAEVTLELNPETATPDYLAAIRAAGATRLSIGVQSFDDGELARLGRVHSADRAREAVRLARGAGFDDLSLDLMMWLPGQSVDALARQRRGPHRDRARPRVALHPRDLPERAAARRNGARRLVAGARRRRGRDVPARTRPFGSRPATSTTKSRTWHARGTSRGTT